MLCCHGSPVCFFCTTMSCTWADLSRPAISSNHVVHCNSHSNKVCLLKHDTENKVLQCEMEENGCSPFDCIYLLRLLYSLQGSNGAVFLWRGSFWTLLRFVSCLVFVGFERVSEVQSLGGKKNNSTSNLTFALLKQSVWRLQGQEQQRSQVTSHSFFLSALPNVAKNKKRGTRH